MGSEEYFPPSQPREGDSEGEGLDMSLLGHDSEWDSSSGSSDSDCDSLLSSVDSEGDEKMQDVATKNRRAPKTKEDRDNRSIRDYLASSNREYLEGFAACEGLFVDTAVSTVPDPDGKRRSSRQAELAQKRIGEKMAGGQVT